MSDLIRHLRNWAEGYLWLPLSLISIYLFAEIAYWLTGRRPQENVDWIIGLAGDFVKCVFLILLVSILRESSGVWLTKEERLANPRFSIAQMFNQSIALCVFAYLLSH
jgi:hypothetical protein